MLSRGKLDFVLVLQLRFNHTPGITPDTFFLKKNSSQALSSDKGVNPSAGTQTICSFFHVHTPSQTCLRGRAKTCAILILFFSSSGVDIIEQLLAKAPLRDRPAPPAPDPGPGGEQVGFHPKRDRPTSRASKTYLAVEQLDPAAESHWVTFGAILITFFGK